MEGNERMCRRPGCKKAVVPAASLRQASDIMSYVRACVAWDAGYCTPICQENDVSAKFERQELWWQEKREP